jgi:hypothetical protein
MRKGRGFFQTIAIYEDQTPGEPLIEKGQPAIQSKGDSNSTEVISSVEVVESSRITQDLHLCLEAIDRGFSFKYPTKQNQHGKTWFQEYRLYHILASEKECWKNLIWKSLTKGISVDEFIIIEYLLLKRWKTFSREEKTAIVEILVLINTRERLVKYLSRLPSVLATLKKHPIVGDKTIDPNLILQEFISVLKLPIKGSKIEFNVLEREQTEYKKPPPVAFIGVGYKDKGSLSDNPRPKYDPEDFVESTATFFEEFSSLRRNFSRW